MKMIALALVGALGATSALAQTTPGTAPGSMPGTTPGMPAMPRGAPPVMTTPGAPVPGAPGVNTSTGTGTGAGVIDRNTGPAAAAGDRNQAVTTTNANAPQPARGHNSFTMGEARARISRTGYTAVADLKKDGNGVWRGNAMKDGAKVGVWLDYKGNIGQQ